MKKLQHCSLQTNASNICTFQAFCSQMSLYANLGSILFWWKKTYKFSLAVCCCLHCVLVFNSFIIKGFSLSALCWTLSCNGGINWSTEISAYNYVLSSAHYFTHTHTLLCRQSMNAEGHVQYVYALAQTVFKACLVLKGLPGILLKQFWCNSPQFNDFSTVSSFVITHFSLQTQIN